MKTVLTDEIKEYIVRGLARYETPSQVARAVAVDFGIEISRQQVHAYDPRCLKRPAQRWCDLHAATRRAFLADIADIGIAQKVVRLRMLERFAQEAEDLNFHKACAAYLVQAAKECGGVYESRKRPLSSAILPPADPEA